MYIILLQLIIVLNIVLSRADVYKRLHRYVCDRTLRNIAFNMCYCQ